MSLPHTSPSASQRGFMLLEALVAMLIFGFGVLGLVALQSKALTQSSQAQYRSVAAYLANDLVNQMQLTNKTPATLTAQFASAPAGASYLAWSSRVNALLPGASSSVTVTTINPLPSIVGPGFGPPSPDLTPSTRVAIQLTWKHPSEPSAATPNQLMVNTEIK